MGKILRCFSNNNLVGNSKMLLWPSYSVAIIMPGVVKKNKIFKKSTKIIRERKKKKKAFRNRSRSLGPKGSKRRT